MMMTLPIRVVDTTDPRCGKIDDGTYFCGVTQFTALRRHKSISMSALKPTVLNAEKGVDYTVEANNDNKKEAANGQLQTELIVSPPKTAS